jgi:RND family efflux transporter MFP subunit
MSNEPIRRLLQSLRQWGGQTDGDALGDVELLERFRAWRDQAAFELLLWRHGPMVLGVCRRLLPTAQDAEDAFQAVWLTFVRKAGSIARGGALGGWLHRVACRVALRARSGLARRARREHNGVDQLGITRESAAPNDLAAILDEEVNRLPARQRLVFVLCCLEGKTGEEAARQLGCARGTVSSRLTRAREQLRRRLTRRGLVPAVALGAAVAEEAVSAPLIQSTLKACFLFSASKSAGGELSAQAVTLAEGVLRAMFLSKLKIVAVLLLAVGLLAAGRALTLRDAEAAPSEEAKQEPPLGEKPREKKDRPVVVQVINPQKGGVDRKTVQVCSAEAFQTVEVYTEVSGLLKTVSVDMGDRVRKGQVLAEIDAPLAALEEKQALSAVKQAYGQLQVAKAGIEGARARVSAAKATVTQRQAELERAKAALTIRQRQLDLVKRQRGTVPMTTQAEKEEQVEAARGDFLAGSAALDRARADVLVREGDLAAADATLEAAEGGLEVARVSLARARLTREMTRIRAPFDGIVTHVVRRAGQQIDERRGPQPLLRLMRIDRLRVVTQVPDHDVPSAKVGRPVTLAFDALPGVAFPHCKVSRIAYTLDEKTRTMRVEVDVPNPQEKLLPGMLGTATILLQKGAADALRLPNSCLVGGATEIDNSHVYVVRDGKAHLAAVKIGGGDPDMVEVLSGLEPTDRVILSPAARIREGAPVEIKEKGPPK